MQHVLFRAWLAEIDDLTPEQRRELEAVLAGRLPRSSVTAAIEAPVADERRCPHCGCTRSVGRGRADGLQRFRCQDCGKSFNALTGTPLARLRQKGHWLDFGRAVRRGGDWPPFFQVAHGDPGMTVPPGILRLPARRMWDRAVSMDTDDAFARGASTMPETRPPRAPEFHVIRDRSDGALMDGQSASSPPTALAIPRRRC